MVAAWISNCPSVANVRERVGHAPAGPRVAVQAMTAQPPAACPPLWARRSKLCDDEARYGPDLHAKLPGPDRERATAGIKRSLQLPLSSQCPLRDREYRR